MYSTLFAKLQNHNIIGIIENHNGRPIARIIMTKNNLVWQSLVSEWETHRIDTNILDMKWDIFFNGKTIGNIYNLNLYKWKYYSEISTYEIIDTSRVVKIKKDRELFENFLGIPQYRPLIMVSGKDPKSKKLKKGSLLKVEKEKLIKEFRLLIKEVFICDNVSTPEKKYIYKDDDVNVLLVYSIPELGRIVKMRLSHKLMKCDYNDYFYWSDMWFLLKEDGKIIYLDPKVGENKALQLMVVDAGDYDNDGRIEILFSINLYNRSGYVLFYSDCKESVKATWNYH